MEIKFTVDLPPRTKKNSMQIIRINGYPRLIPSKAFREYEALAKDFMPDAFVPIDERVNIKCLFYMPTKRRVDLTNLLEAIDDIMVKYKVIPDDAYTVIGGHDGSRVLYDKERPRTEVYIKTMKE